MQLDIEESTTISVCNYTIPGVQYLNIQIKKS